ncbi:MAG: membrane protein insertion efficiency factor YidD [Patescibacteria group bacterium]|jgi:hypothetical protein
MNPFKAIAVFLIIIYQKTLSFDHGPLKIFHPYGYCRFHPSCSEYSKQAIERFGLIKGGFLATSRILRCNPWSKGGIDEVPGTEKVVIGNPENESKDGKDLSDQDFVEIINLYKKQVVVPSKVSSKPFILCPIGLVGSGKTTVIKPMAEYFGLVRVSNDEIRKILISKGFNLTRTVELGFGVAKEFVEKGFGLAVDADCAGPNIVKTINELANKVGLKVFLIHLNTPEDFILEGIKKSRSDAENFIQIYHKRKILHENLNFSFIYTFDLSRGNVDEQIKECERIIEEEIK